MNDKFIDDDDFSDTSVLPYVATGISVSAIFIGVTVVTQRLLLCSGITMALFALLSVCCTKLVTAKWRMSSATGQNEILLQAWAIYAFGFSAVLVFTDVAIDCPAHKNAVAIVLACVTLISVLWDCKVGCINRAPFFAFPALLNAIVATTSIVCISLGACGLS